VGGQIRELLDMREQGHDVLNKEEIEYVLHHVCTT
jgi:hypothetical protein